MKAYYRRDASLRVGCGRSSRLRLGQISGVCLSHRSLSDICLACIDHLQGSKINIRVHFDVKGEAAIDSAWG